MSGVVIVEHRRLHRLTQQNLGVLALEEGLQVIQGAATRERIDEHRQHHQPRLELPFGRNQAVDQGPQAQTLGNSPHDGPVVDFG
jgi:hypothetical protein